MKKTGLIVGFFVVFVILVGLPYAFAGQSVQGEGWTPFTATYSNCGNGEDIEIIGMYKWTSREWWDASGGYHISYMYMERGYGVGSISGSGYRLEDRNPIELINNGEHTLMFSGVLIALDKGVPDLLVRILVHTTYDANGNLRADIDFEDFNCTQP